MQLCMHAAMPLRLFDRTQQTDRRSTRAFSNADGAHRTAFTYLIAIQRRLSRPN